MAIVVPSQRPAVRSTENRAGLAVRGQTWHRAGEASNWLAGRGTQLIPGGFGFTTSGTSRHELYWKAQPRYQALQRMWCIDMQPVPQLSGDSWPYEVQSTVLIEIPIGTSQRTLTISGAGESRANTFGVLQSLTSQSSSEATLSMGITRSAGDECIIRSISCWEVPRPVLAEAGSDQGADLAKLISGQPGLADSIAPIVDGTNTQYGLLPRRHLLQWSVPGLVGGSASTAFARATTSTSWGTYVLETGIPVLVRKDARGDTTGNLTARIHAWCSTGTGEVRLSTTSGGASTASTVSVTSPGTTGSPNYTTISYADGADCEDLASADGRQTAASPAWDTVNVEFRKITSGTIYVAGISIWEN